VGPGDDFHLGYRMRQEAEPWLADDQVARLAATIEPQRRRQIEGEVECEIEVAFAFAEVSPEPKHETPWIGAAQNAPAGTKNTDRKMRDRKIIRTEMRAAA
jgi:TPP-dependent pyruvate/acetoin dehydrogenase alpha subunit